MSSDGAETSWKLPQPRNPVAWYVGLFVLGLALYGLYAWAVAELMARVIFAARAPPNAGNPIGMFVVFTGALMLYLLLLGEIEREKTRARLFMEFQLAVRRVIDNLYFSVNAAAMRGLYTVAGYDSLQGMQYEGADILAETTVLFMLAVLLLLWEFGATGRSREHGMDIVASLSQETLGFPTHARHVFGAMLAHAPAQHWGFVMLHFAQWRVMQLHHGRGLRGLLALADTLIVPHITDARQRCDNFIVFARGSKFWWITVVVRVFSVLYMLAVPFLLWPTQGYLAILWAEVVYVLVHSVILYRFLLANVFTAPTKWDMGAILQDLDALARAADAAYARLRAGQPARPFAVQAPCAAVLRRLTAASTSIFAPQ